MEEQRRGYMVIGLQEQEQEENKKKKILIIGIAVFFAVTIISATIVLAVLINQNEGGGGGFTDDVDLDDDPDVPFLPQDFEEVVPQPVSLVSDEDGNAAMQHAMSKFEISLFYNGNLDDNEELENNMAAQRHFSIGKPMCNETQERISWGSIRQEAWRHLKTMGKGEGLVLFAGAEDHPCQRDMERKCSRKDEGPYRTMKGTCNNLRNMTWGSANRVYRRLLPADYKDGVSEPRDRPPGAREVSAVFHKPKINKDRACSSLMTLWGQFIAHDTTRVAASSEKKGRRIKCCQGNGPFHEDCFPIEVSDEDPFYGSRGVRCLEFVRSASAARSGCLMGPREQLNTLTSYLDASAVYGTSDEESWSLRTGKGGTLRSTNIGDGDLLPIKDRDDGSCGKNASCFLAGDIRANEHGLLTAMHTLWLRQHNRIARELSSLNTNWSDEQLFQETRRLVAAQIQHITFNEYLPAILGDKIMTDFGLSLFQEGYYEGYDSLADATVSNEFATAAFRFGHSTVQGLVELMSGDNFEVVQLRKTMFNAEPFCHNETVAKLLVGAANQNAEGSDRFFTMQLSNQLFASKELGYGLDLVSINIQRSRDHGLESYNDYRKLCGLRRINSWKMLSQVTDTQSSELLRQLYHGDIEEVELYSAGMSERHVTGGVLGPTFACIVAEQMRRTKQGDRYWYENGPQSSPYPFTPDQLSHVRKTTLARIMCDNLSTIRNIHPKVLLVPSNSNQPVTCLGSAIPSTDLIFWQYGDNEDDSYASK